MLGEGRRGDMLGEDGEGGGEGRGRRRQSGAVGKRKEKNVPSVNSTKT